MTETAARWPSWLAAAVAVAAVVCATRTAGADPLRLRGDVYADSRAHVPAGLLALDAGGDLRRWLSAEALVWLGAGGESELDAMVIAVRARDPGGRGEARLGRFLVVPGAVRPVHIDGAGGLVRTRWAALELFGGVPVVPGLGARAYDWAAGGRVSRPFGDWGSAGVAYLQRREQGRLADAEVGADAGLAPADWVDAGVRVAYDISGASPPGISDAAAVVAVQAAPRARPWHRRPWRLEVRAGYRSPARILPATSLFSVLGDVASRDVGAAVTWRAAPRLDVIGDAAVRLYRGSGGDPDGPGDPGDPGDGAAGPDAGSDGAGAGADLRARAVLRLDDRGTGRVIAELRRNDAPGAAWTGARAAVHVPLGPPAAVAGAVRGLSATAELELVVPDEPAGRGAAWPWGVVGASADLGGGWGAAVAVEAGASPQYAWRVDAIARLSRAWEAP